MRTLRLIQALYEGADGISRRSYKIHIANDRGYPLCENSYYAQSDRKATKWLSVDDEGKKATCVLCLKQISRCQEALSRG